MTLSRVLPNVATPCQDSPMTFPSRQTRAKASVVTFKPNPAPVTLEQAGILPGSSLLATKEDIAERERQEQARIAQGTAIIDAALKDIFSCRACGGTAVGSSLCGDCTAVAAQLRAQARMHDDIAGRSRADRVRDYLAQQS